MMNRLLLPAFLLALCAGCSSSDEAGRAPSPPEEIATPTAGGLDPKAPETYQVRLETTQGDVLIDVDRKLAPHGADRFYRLIKEGFYNEAKFFRVIPGFVAQVGMAADPKVNDQWQEATIPDDPVRESNTRGMVSFATSGPNSRTSQFFINFGDNRNLDGMGFSPFGRVAEGMENVEKLYSGYGESPSQGAIAAEGNAYLERDFPELDAIKKATVVSENGEPVGEETEKAASKADSVEPANPQDDTTK